MSVSGNYFGGVQTPTPTRLTSTSATAVATGVDRFSVVSAWSLANETGSAVQVSLHFNDGATDFMIWRGSVAANGTTVVSDLPILLREGQSIKATAASANAITVTPIIIRSHANEPANWDRGTGRG